MERIYSSADLDVFVRDGEGGTVAVTFSNWTSVQPRPLWEKQLQTPAVFFVALRNHWYQVQDAGAAIEAATPHLARFSRRVLMGSSMGGFAAMAFAAKMGATRTVAISPQVSLDPSLAPFEKRWRPEAATINEWHHRISANEIPAHILFDPKHAADCSHAHAIAAEHGNTIRWPLAFSGHPTGFALADLSLLERFVQDAVSGADEVNLFSSISDEYDRTCTRSVTVAINDLRYGTKRACDMTPNQVDLLAGSDSAKKQLAGIIARERQTPEVASVGR